MSREQAFEVLGLAPSADAQEIGAAHRRLEELLDPQRGGTAYLSLEINEARDVLLGE
jgi:curved DNA-binding protein CbpA